MIEFGHASHAGLRREHNEDTYWADADAGLFLIADGMGGHGRGEVAAAIARDAVVDAARAGHDLDTAIRAVGKVIAAQARQATGLPPMGTTLAALQLDADGFRAYRVGDSRILLWYQAQLMRVDDGEPQRAETNDTEADGAEPPPPRRNRATQALGITPSTDLCAEPVAGALQHGMQFLICSGSLLEAIGEPAITAVLARTELAAQECVDHLVLAALDAGGRDNLTVLLVRVMMP
ncbi:MAG TPA: protein phosphatase 2C domain-containing protein [Rhodanobacteraceae bacterium]|nr:protein phosphatase 2C domain-containing protein [Rhodanobacteraceae bacterium]